MDSYLISQFAGAAGVATIVVGTYLQSLYPDTKRMRHMRMLAGASNAISFFALGKPLGSAGGTIGLSRTMLRATDFGRHHRVKLALAASAAMGLSTWQLMERPTDLFATAGIVAGSVSDYCLQGRHARLANVICTGFTWLPYAIATRNPATAVSYVVATGIGLNAIYQHDFKNAAGKDKTKWENLKAYAHGIAFHSATGALIEGQVNEGKENAPKLQAHDYYQNLCDGTPNPGFSGREERLAEMRTQLAL